MFQSTHPFGCDYNLNLVDTYLQCFNPRTRLGATSIRNVVGLVDRVSIHAPVWVRLDEIHKAFDDLSFNPRTRLGATKMLKKSIR